MALNKENLAFLVSLQTQDAGLDAILKELEAVPAEIQLLKTNLEGEKSDMASAKAKVLDLEKKKKVKELDLSQKEESVKKHGQELNQVKTNEAFKALQSEIDQAKADGDAIETEILGLMEEIDAAQAADKKFQGEFKGIEAKVQGEIGVLETKLKEIQARFDSAKSKRDEASAPVPKDAMRIYDHIRKRGKEDAVVPVDGEMCSACRITLSPQVIVDVTKGTQLVSCESCQRILYKAAKPAAKSV